MVEKTALSRFTRKAKSIYQETDNPTARRSGDYEMAYGVFLGYTLGINPAGYTNEQYAAMVEKRLDLDIKSHAAYIAKKIVDLGLDGHSFTSTFFLLMMLN